MNIILATIEHIRIIICMQTTHTNAHSFGCTVGNKTEFFQSASLTEEEFQERPIINWDAILWVNRPVELWGVQLVLALISLTEALLLTYLGYKGNIWQQILSFHFILELVTTIPFALTVSRIRLCPVRPFH